MKFYEFINDEEVFKSYKGNDKVELECDYCSGLYVRTKKTLQQKACTTKINKCFCSEICYRKGCAEAQRKPIEVFCDACKKSIIKNPVLIRRNKSGIFSCSEKCRYLTKLKYSYRTCKVCFTKYKYESGINTKRKCSQCTYDYEKYKLFTVQEYKSLNNKQLSRASLRSRIANFCRSWNSGLQSHACQVCKYSLITEFAHIISVSEHIKLNSTLGAINDPNNIFVLCPTHHAEFDRGLRKIQDIPLRVDQEILNLHTNNCTHVRDSTDTHEPSQD